MPSCSLSRTLAATVAARPALPPGARARPDGGVSRRPGAPYRAPVPAERHVAAEGEAT